MATSTQSEDPTQMHLMTELLMAAREADLERDRRERWRQRPFEACRRRLLGILPIGPACD